MKDKEISIKDELTEFLLYTAPGGDVKIEIYFHDDNIWLTQTMLAELFETTKQNIGKHIKNILKEQELQEDSVVNYLFTTAKDGKSYNVKHYNLDLIISVDYRVNSTKATQFRQWATKILKEYTIKGFAVDDDRLKNGQYFGKDYFQELLERVRSIRASERRIYQKITDIFAECSIDYDSNSETCLIYSISGCQKRFKLCYQFK